MAIFLTEEQSTNTGANGRFKKADGFANFSLLLHNGNGEEVKLKLCAAPLHEDKELGELIINGFKEDPEGFAEKLKAKLVIEYNSATPQKRGLSL